MSAADDADAFWKDPEKYFEELSRKMAEELAEAWADAIKGTAPQGRTKLLSSTAHAEGPDVKLQKYWKWVAYGHRVYSPAGSSSGTIERRDAFGKTQERIEVTKPNPFMEEAWKSHQVQDVLKKYGLQGLTQSYPLKKVGR